MSTTTNRTAQSIYPALRYKDAKTAIIWLKSALGFTEREVHQGEAGSIAHAELALNGNLIMLGSVKGDSFGASPQDLGGVTGTIYVAVEGPAEVEAHYSRAKSAGAAIVRELSDTEYGSREFTLRDPEGHIWSFGTYRPQAS